MEQIINEAQKQHQQYVCSICYELSHDAVQSNCCHKTYCEKCASRIKSKQPICPYCRSKQFDYEVSGYRQAINSIKLPCEMCSQQFIFHQITNHLNVCEMNQLKCRFCNNISTRRDIVKHTYQEHQKQIGNIIKQYQLFGVLSVNYQQLQNNVTLNQKGRKVHLGNSGKVYCGGQLQGDCPCCNGYCGPTNGQNCRACMKLDLKRRGIPKGYLINADNNACWETKTNSGIFICGVFTGWRYQQFGQQHQSCFELNPCNRCISVAKSAQQRYRDLF